MSDEASALAAAIPDGDAFLQCLSGPFRRALRWHPQRGAGHGWGAVEPVPWSCQGVFHADDIDPATRLDYHTGVAWPQDAASQLPVTLLAPQPGEIVVDACAAPGSKSTQIGIALGDTGLLVCVDRSAKRRAVLGETLARQGVTCALVTPLPLDRLAASGPGAADAVLVDAPCSGHVRCRSGQVTASARRQARILIAAAHLVRPGGRLVYSTCTPYRGENEDLIERFLAHHPDFSVLPTSVPGASPDLAGLGGWRLWPQRHGTEPFFAIALTRAGARLATGWPGNMPDTVPGAESAWLESVRQADLAVYLRGERVLAASALAAAAALPSEARGLIIGRSGGADGFRWEPWGVQWGMSRGLPAATVTHDDACRLWAGERLSTADIRLSESGPVCTQHGAPLGWARVDHEGVRLQLPSRLVRRVV